MEKIESNNSYVEAGSDLWNPAITYNPINFPEIKHTIYKKVLECQNKLRDQIKATSEAKISYNYSYKYITLADLLNIVLPILYEENVLYTTYEECDHLIVALVDVDNPLSKITGRIKLQTIELSEPSIAEIYKRKLELLTDADKIAKFEPPYMDMQDKGAAYTYAKRIGLLGLLGLTADTDDDAASISKPIESKARDNKPRENGSGERLASEKQISFINDLKDRNPDKFNKLPEEKQQEFMDAIRNNTLTSDKANKIIDYFKG